MKTFGDKICVIGAGSSGLAAAKNLLEAGFAVDVLEKELELGGLWHYDQNSGRVYKSTHMISSKPFTQYPDFPMPEHFPDYPHHTQVLEYLRAYADRFDLHPHISYDTEVEQIRRTDDDEGWKVTVDGEERRYAVVVIANGHNWSPKYPVVPGTFDGEAIHSAFYRTPDVFFGKRVLVVGAGNSGCDIVVEAVTNADAVFHSTRRAYHYVPKYVLGRPSDQVGDLMHRLKLPLWLRRGISSVVLRFAVGSYEDRGLPAPDHKLFETHPIVNTLLPYHVAHGRIRQKPDVERLDGSRVVFVDGSSEAIDLIVYATGYEIRFPFIDRSYLNWHDGYPHLYLNVFHPEFDDLFVAGMIQPDSGQFGLVHWQTRAISAFLAARKEGRSSAKRLDARRRETDSNPGAGIRYKDSSRHHLEVEHWSYLKALQRTVRRLEA